MTEQDDHSLDAEPAATRETISNHPTYTYGELYELYRQFTQAVNSAAYHKGKVIMSARERIRPQSFDEFATAFAQSPLREISRNVELWQNAVNRQRRDIARDDRYR